MVWGVLEFISLKPRGSDSFAQWTICVIFLTFVALAMAELASSAPTSGGLYYWTYTYSTPKWRRFLSWVVGCKLILMVQINRLLIFSVQPDTNTICSITAVCSIDWGCGELIHECMNVSNTLQSSSDHVGGFNWIELLLRSKNRTDFVGVFHCLLLYIKHYSVVYLLPWWSPMQLFAALQAK
jgi:amino acid transporter